MPVIEDPPLARALYAGMEVDQVIPHQHYEAVAKISFPGMHYRKVIADVRPRNDHRG